MKKSPKEIMIIDSPTFSRVISRMAHEIIEKHPDLRNIVLVGIKQGGTWLKERIKREIEAKEGITLMAGDIDITMYRDDIFKVGYHPRVETTEIPFSLDDRDIVLIDDVLFTGRTVRAAMDVLFEFGRPTTIQLAAMIDRGHRELPIQADFVGKVVPTSRKEMVVVMFAEKDGKDGVTLREKHG